MEDGIDNCEATLGSTYLGLARPFFSSISSQLLQAKSSGQVKYRDFVLLLILFLDVQSTEVCSK